MSVLSPGCADVYLTVNKRQVVPVGIGSWISLGLVLRCERPFAQCTRLSRRPAVLIFAFAIARLADKHATLLLALGSGPDPSAPSFGRCECLRRTRRKSESGRFSFRAVRKGEVGTTDSVEDTRPHGIFTVVDDGEFSVSGGHRRQGYQSRKENGFMHGCFYKECWSFNERASSSESQRAKVYLARCVYGVDGRVVQRVTCTLFDDWIQLSASIPS